MPPPTSFSFNPTIMEYYRILASVDELRAANGRVVGKGGDIIELALDSTDKQTLRQAQEIMLGNQHKLTRVDKPEKVTKKKSKKAAVKGTYETREMTAQVATEKTPAKPAVGGKGKEG